MSLLANPGVILTPSASKTPTGQNYLGSDDFDFINQYLPETEKKIFNRFGSQDVTGMLQLLGKQKSFASDKILWKEEARLRMLGTGVARTANVFTLANHNFRAGETIIARNADGSAVRQGRISAVAGNDFTVLCGEAAGWAAIGTTAITVFIDANEFGKDTGGFDESLDTKFSSFEQSPVIIKEMVKESGSNMAQITWLEVSNSGTGESGYVWYFRNYNDTVRRFDNAIEAKQMRGKRWAGDLLAAGYQGTEGLFEIASQGNIFSGQISDLNDADEVVERMEAQGGISMNYLYGTTSFKASIDDFLQAENVTGLSWGAFDNDSGKAMNLGFDGFKRSGYEFSTSRWRMLTDPTMEGSMVGASKINAVMIPSGSKTLRDQVNGGSTTEPMLQERFRSYGKENRKYEVVMRSFKEGTTNGQDRVITDFLTERCLQACGRNNFMIFKG